MKCHQKMPEFLQWMRQEIDQFVEGCPTDTKWEDIMKLVDDDMCLSHI